MHRQATYFAHPCIQILLSYSVNIHISVNFYNHALQGLAWSALSEIVGTVGNHVLHALRPTHRAGELGNEVLLDFGRIGMRFAVNILIDGAHGCIDFCLFDGGLQLILGGLHER